MPASAGDLRLMEVVGVKSKPDYNGEELRILFFVTWHQFSLMKSRQNCPRSEISSGGLSFSDWLNVCLGVKTVVPIGFSSRLKADRYEVKFEGGRYDTVVWAPGRLQATRRYGI